jgi:HNH endonuclease
MLCVQRNGKLRRPAQAPKFSGCGKELPLGAVTIRRHSRGGRMRFVKVAMRGPLKDRWQSYARDWWLRNRGPIPDGLRVIHADGDSLNDDPSNYVLGTADDVLMLIRDWDPSLDERNRKNQTAATVESNRLRGLIRRATSFLRWRWYPVDHARKVILNTPFRSRWQAFGPGAPRGGKNGDAATACWAMGWPGRPLVEACVLRVLTDSPGDITSKELVCAVRSVKAAYRPSRKPLLRSTLYCALSVLQREDLVLRGPRQGQKLCWYRASSLARQIQGTVSPWLPARGSYLLDGNCVGYEKVAL